MSPIAVCPSCGEKLQASQGVRRGTAVRCPYCSATFSFDPTLRPAKRRRPRRPDRALIYAGVGAGASAVVVTVILLCLFSGERSVRTPEAERSAAARAPQASVPQPGIRLSETEAAEAPPPAALRADAGGAVHPRQLVLVTPAPVVDAFDSHQSAVVAPLAAEEFRYGWKAGDRLAYDLSMSVELEGVSLTISGVDVYTFKSAENLFESVPDSATGNGTAFVVNSHGYLLSCAHVVQGATKIEVILGEKTYPCEVLAEDEGNDLAILQIPASGLPVLGLGDSDDVLVAEEVRVIGYPLAGVLGNSVKITRGSVSGKITLEDASLLQVDASVNPGNSGGPLLNESGAVVGVVNAKLAGEAISNVGFSVPINVAKAFLRKHGVPFATREVGRRLEGPLLARRTTPAVALVSITGAMEGAGHGRRLLVEVQSYARIWGRPDDSDDMLSAPGICQTATLVVDEFGEVLHTRGEHIVPWMMGPLGQCAMIRLSPTREESWNVQGPTTIAYVDASPASLTGQFDLRGPGELQLGGYGGAPSVGGVSVLPAFKSTEYRVRESSGDEFTVSLKHRFGTLQGPNEPPLFRLMGEGTATIDKRRAIPTRLYFTAAIDGQGQHAVHVPITVTYRLTELEKAEKMLAENEYNDLLARPPGASTDPLDRSVEALQSGRLTYSQKLAMLDVLLATPVVERKRKAVADAVRPMITQQRYGVTDAAAKVLCAWGGEEDLLLLVRRWEILAGTTKEKAITRLGEIGTERSAELLVQLVLDAREESALTALRKMGPVAEKPVIALLLHQHPNVRIEACRLLGTIGGKRSFTALLGLARRDRVFAVKEAAKAAARKVRVATDEAEKPEPPRSPHSALVPVGDED